MSFRILDPKAALKLLELARQRVKPPEEILELKRQIEEETRIAEFDLSSTRVINQQAVEKIVEMKLNLDTLYGLWAEQEVEQESN